MDLNIIEETVNLECENGTCVILFAGNLDLYWTFIPNKSADKKNKYSFVIDKSFPFVYNNIEALFDAIVKNKPYKNAYHIDDMELREKELPNYKSSESLNLIINNKIVWKSDDFCEEEASQLIIEKMKDNFLITFKKSNSKEYHNTFSIRFRNSGSRYDPYNVSFMNSYKELKDWDGQLSLF